MKQCSGCREDKEESDFGRKRAGLQDKCKSCKKAYAQGHYKKNKEKYLARALERGPRRRKEYRERINQLKSAPCVDCKKSYPPYVMDFDHRRDKKLSEIGRAIANQWPWDEILAEIAKCDLVCANCHRIRTFSKVSSVG